MRGHRVAGIHTNSIKSGHLICVLNKNSEKHYNNYCKIIIMNIFTVSMKDTFSTGKDTTLKDPI